jgi:hypothetical protein
VAKAGETKNRVIKIVAKEWLSVFFMARDYTYDFVPEKGICISSLMEFTESTSEPRSGSDRVQRARPQIN